MLIGYARVSTVDQNLALQRDALNRPMHRIDAYQMVRRRTAETGLNGKFGCHVFRATGITAYLKAGGTLENTQALAAHESPRTTKLYDQRAA
jgi:integrase/recombinase XerD